VRTTFTILFSLSIAGCAVGPDYTGAPRNPAVTQDHVPRDVTPVAKPDGWWKTFRDPVLDRLIGEAVEGNQDVAAAKARILEARATRAQAVGGLFPAVSGTGSVLAERSSSTAVLSVGAGQVDSGSTQFTQYSGGLDASWELDLFGAQYRAVEATSYGVEAAEEDLRYVLVTLVGDVASYYVDATGATERIAIARRNAAEERETERLTRAKAAAGSATDSDVAKAAALALSTEAEIPSYQNSFAVAAHRIGVLLGRSPDSVAALLGGRSGVPRPVTRLRAGLPADLLRNRPDVRRAERRLAQYTARIGQAEAALYPDVSLTGSLTSTALRPSDFAKASTVSWSFGPSVSVPIFDGGKLRAAVDIARAQRDEYLAAYHASVLTAVEDVENAVVALSTERHRMRALSASAAYYETAARSAKILFESGSSSFLDLLDAQRSLRSAQDTVVQSRMASAKDYVALAKALGGGWDRAVDPSVPAVTDEGTGPHPRRRPAA
jgi:NodT family efflux transporter outer membrane factor (OMF) lipoprotein